MIVAARSTVHDLVLVGAGGFARETVEVVRAINLIEPTFELLGFLDDDSSLHGEQRSGLPILGPLEWIVDRPSVRVAVCVGSPTSVGVRRRVVDRLDLPDDRYATLIHPAAVVPGSVSVGPGSVIHAGTICTAELTIGRHVGVMPGVVLTHDDVIEDRVILAAGVRVAGEVTIAHDAYIGASASIRERLHIGSGALIGMGSVVTRDVPAGELWLGNPARRIRDVSDS